MYLFTRYYQPASMSMMSVSPATFGRLSAIPDAQLLPNVPLSNYTRFGIGGPASLLFDTSSEPAFVEALRVMSETTDPHVVIGGGTNLVVADSGFDGVVLRYTGQQIQRNGLTIIVQAGAVLQDVVDFSNSARDAGTSDHDRNPRVSRRCCLW